MPRRSTAANLAAQPSSQHTIRPPSPASASENLALLRTQWKWAAFCQFFSTFALLFPMNDVSISDIESDLVEGTGRVLPRIMTRLLYTLTYDRKISIDNWQSMLRKQYAKRAPDLDPLGAQPLREPSPTCSEDKTYVCDNDSQLEPLEQLLEQPPPENVERDFAAQSSETAQNNGPDDWFKLSMNQKLESMHLLTEWHFQHPMRLRTLMKSDDEDASWRIEPIGYDKQSNAYWFIGSDRLWIQRSLPKSHKIKNMKTPDNDASQASTSGRAKRRRLGKDLEHNDETIFAVLPTPKDRTAKTRAKVKLDTHAQAPSGLVQTSRSRESKYGTTSRPILGTRASARLRGIQQTEWQPVPREWMEEGTGLETQPTKTGLESDLDELSELTELSDDSYDEPPDTVEKFTPPDGIGHQSTSGEAPQKDFVEWETICVTLHDWDHIADRFASGTHYSEKALYKYLVNHLVPSVSENLKNVERQKRLEDAVTYRKRSSRIALKESEREQALAVARKREEEGERLSRAKRLEARQQREEERRMRQENSRVQRRKERESKEAQREKGLEPEQGVEEGDCSDSTSANPSSFLRPPTTSNWELDCEICRRHEISPADNTPMVSCGACLKWQHIVCHDLANQRAGFPKRDWDSVDFICRSCRTKANVGYRPIEPESSLLYGPKESTRPISRTNPSMAHGRPVPMPGPVYKLPTTVHDSVRDAPLSSPPLTQSSNVIGTQNMVVPPLESTAAANFVYDQTRWNISSPNRVSYHQTAPDWLGLERGEHKDRTPYEHSSIFGRSTRGNPYLATPLDASQPTFKLSHYTTMHRDHQF